MVSAMNIHKRIIVQFFIQLTLVFILFFFLFLAIWGVIGFTIMKDEITQDLSKADSTYFSDKINITGDKVTFEEDLKKLVKKQEGWLLVVNDKGHLIGEYNAPNPIPKRFNESTLGKLILQKDADSLDYTHWKLDEMKDESPILIFARENMETVILNNIKSTVDWDNQQINLTAPIIQHLNNHSAWVQLINSSGEVVEGYGTKSKSVSKYTLADFQALSANTEVITDAYFDAATEQTIIVGMPNVNSATNLKTFLLNINNGIMILFAGLILFLIIFTFWYARKFGVPLVTMMKWIQNLGNGKYEQPIDLGQKNGKLKRKFRLFKDLIATLSNLTETLQKNQTQSRKMVQTREEWISGLSHDLKTPLASITGYAQMLESKKYSWSEDEAREFAKIIAEKSRYMMKLIEDLTLTYRLKNEALPISKEKVDMIEYLRRTIIHFMNDPANKEVQFDFQPKDKVIFASIDIKWFQRVIDNLIANAIKYNPSGTTINISIEPIEDQLVIITIEDDGEGMDEETLANLFNRYYRGTNTSDSNNGTGLGMAITKQLVQLHGGSINVKSTPHKGTIVRMIIPR